MISFKEFIKLNEGSYKVYKPKLHQINVRSTSGTAKELLGNVGEFGTGTDLSKDDHYKAAIDAAHEYGKTKFGGKYEIIHIDHHGQKIPAGSVAKVRRSMNESEELDESASRFIQKVNQAANAAASGNHKNAQMHLDNARSFMLGIKSTDMGKIKDAHETYKNLRKKYSGSGGNFTPSHNQVGNAKVSESEE